MQIFPRCLRILKDRLIQKFFAVFPRWTDFETEIFRGFPWFLGDPKILKTRIFPQCLGILKDWLIQKFHALNDIDVENVTTGDMDTGSDEEGMEVAA